MKTRKIINGEPVFFQSENNFASDLDAVVQSLTQKLSTLKNELWYNYLYGMPLFEKVKTKAVIDAYVSSVISSDENITSVTSFESSIVNNKYTCKMKLETVFGQISVNL